MVASEFLTRKAFIDDSLQSEFEQNGYVVIPGFLDRDSLALLGDLYSRFSQNVPPGFHVTNWVRDTKYSLESDEKVRSVLSDKLEGILNDYKPVLGCFAVKEPGTDNTMGLHQDWSLTDESRYCGLSVWVPLTDVTEETGALKMLKASHRLFSNIRGQKIKNQLDNLPPETISKYLTCVPVKAGDLLVLHHRIVHCSGHTPRRRISAMMALIPKEAKVRHYMAGEKDQAEELLRVFDCPDDFYVHFDIESSPDPEYETAMVKQTEFTVTEPVIVGYYNK